MISQKRIFPLSGWGLGTTVTRLFGLLPVREAVRLSRKATVAAIQFMIQMLRSTAKAVRTPRMAFETTLAWIANSRRRLEPVE